MHCDYSCPVCGGRYTKEHFQVDFNKNCEEGRGFKLEDSGNSVVYYRCFDCNHLFAPMFKSWSADKYRELIYNDEYILVDKDYGGRRSEKNMVSLVKKFGSNLPARHLDYGCGDGDLAWKLGVAEGWKSTGYDPHNKNHSKRPEGTFKLITAFEVFEHCAEPHRMMQDILSFTDKDSIIVFSTSVSDHIITSVTNSGKNWWYVAPRNGHISIFSELSLRTLLLMYDLRLMWFAPCGFMAFRTEIPDWVCKTLHY